MLYLRRGRIAVGLLTAAMFLVLALVSSDVLPLRVAQAQNRVNNQQKPDEETIEDFMKIKLAAINGAMEAAANDDFKAVERAGWELVELSKQAAWKQQSNATYLQDTADFVQSAEFMIRMAQSEDSQGVAHSYGAVAACCLNCHRHVRSPKLALREVSGGEVLAMAGEHDRR